MHHRVLVLVVTLSASALAWAQDADDEAVRQLSITQAHLRDVKPQGASAAGKQVLVRLLGKMLSEQFKGVRVDLDSTLAPDQAAALTQPGGLHFNRRAEICFENYRVGLRRDGLTLRYELSF